MPVLSSWVASDYKVDHTKRRESGTVVSIRFDEPACYFCCYRQWDNKVLFNDIRVIILMIHLFQLFWTGEFNHRCVYFSINIVQLTMNNDVTHNYIARKHAHTMYWYRSQFAVRTLKLGTIARIKIRVAFCYCFNHSVWNNHRKRQILSKYTPAGSAGRDSGTGTIGSGIGSRPICPGNLKSGVWNHFLCDCVKSDRTV